MPFERSTKNAHEIQDFLRTGVHEGRSGEGFTSFKRGGGRKTDRHRERLRGEREKRERQRQTQRQTERHRETDRQTETERQRETKTERLELENFNTQG